VGGVEKDLDFSQGKAKLMKEVVLFNPPTKYTGEGQGNQIISPKCQGILGHNSISSFFLIRQFISVWPLIQKGRWILPKIIRKQLRQNFRGSFKDPLLYLAIIAVFLFAFTVLGAPALLSSSSVKLSLLSIPQNPDKLANNNFYLNQEGRGKFDFPPFNTLQNNSFIGISTPVNVSPQVLGALDGEISDSRGARNEIIEYTVQTGDALSSLAERFNISLNTILWANGLPSNSKIKAGQKLIILPVSGLVHHVKKGETIGGLASLYKAKTSEIIAFNDLPGGGEIFFGDILIIPNGQKPSLPTYRAAPSQVPLASSYFICPISSPCTISQGLHWYNAVDFTHGQCGEPIYAAAQGTVLKAKYGWNGGAGNYLTILHPNRVVTMYGHLATILVNPDQEVSQGQIIATMGGKPGTPGAGRSTGCHVHFGVSGARNPFGG
jgi:murein DD-endopeptidase MepM/ murein hydrolase activator NlpD